MQWVITPYKVENKKNYIRSSMFVQNFAKNEMPFDEIIMSHYRVSESCAARVSNFLLNALRCMELMIEAGKYGHTLYTC
jgi:hypothetical protein